MAPPIHRCPAAAKMLAKAKDRTLYAAMHCISVMERKITLLPSPPRSLSPAVAFTSKCTSVSYLEHEKSMPLWGESISNLSCAGGDSGDWARSHALCPPVPDGKLIPSRVHT